MLGWLVSDLAELILQLTSSSMFSLSCSCSDFSLFLPSDLDILESPLGQYKKFIGWILCLNILGQSDFYPFPLHVCVAWRLLIPSSLGSLHFFPTFIQGILVWSLPLWSLLRRRSLGHYTALDSKGWLWFSLKAWLPRSCLVSEQLVQSVFD